MPIKIRQNGAWVEVSGSSGVSSISITNDSVVPVGAVFHFNVALFACIKY